MMQAGDALAPGTRLLEFTIEAELGAGGFGVTYLARDESLEVRRAVKEYLPRDWGTRRNDGTVGPRGGVDAPDYDRGLMRFLDEARTLARFDHPHLVSVYRVFEARGTAYMVMEHVEGRTLQAEVEAAGPLSEARVRSILDALTDGLSQVHAAGLLHRDIKPENVMVRPDGTPVLIDFGAARHAMGRRSRALTAVLTPGYAPIEQYSARGRQGPWTDIYALGALAYWALSGREPEDSPGRLPVDKLPPLARIAPRPVSRELAAAVNSALAVNETDRPQSLRAWRELLRAPVTAWTEEPFGPAADRSPELELDGDDADSDVPLPREEPASGSPWHWWLAGAVAVGLASVAAAVSLGHFRNGTASEASVAPGPESTAAEVAPPPPNPSPLPPSRPNPLPLETPEPTPDPETDEPAVEMDLPETQVAGDPPPEPPPPQPAPAAPVVARTGEPGPAGTDTAAPAPPAAEVKPIVPPDQPVVAGVDIPRPRRIHTVEPVYPPAARQEGVQGRVVLEVLVGPDGTVSDVIVRSSVPLLDEAAMAAVRQWRYAPTFREGEPIAVVVTVAITFGVS